MNSKPTLILDLDGVIIDFVRPAMALHSGGIATEADYPPDCQWNIVRATNRVRKQNGFGPVTPAHFWSSLDYDFWMNLKMYPFAQAFVETLGGFGDIHIATAPILSSECVAAKFDWINMYLPAYSRKHSIGADKSVMANSNSVLIDDRDKNCKDFIEAGGHAILVPRPWNKRVGTKGHPYDVVIDELRGIL